MGKVNYYINGTDIRSYGVHVGAGKGLLSLPERKKGVSHSYDNEHGISVDTESCFVKERKITLSCFTDKMTHSQFLTALANFKLALMTGGLFQLLLSIEGTEPIPYMVYWDGKADVTPKYNGSKQIGTFELTLVEPEPVKRVWKVVTTAAEVQAEIILSSGPSKYYNIYWGDGDADPGTTIGEGVSHEYASAGTYYIVLTGDVASLVTTTSANSAQRTMTQLWSQLL